MMALMLILASQSPRRRELLAAAGIPFEVRVAGIPEEILPGERCQDHVRRLAREKASAVRRSDGEAVLGADTVVVVDEEILGKPTDVADGRRMLRKLSGRDHEVITGVAILHDGGVVIDYCRTVVHFASLSDAEIDAYLASGEPDDKAGAYAIQGLASKFIDRIEGDYCNVVGLPVAVVYGHLKKLRMV
jgi:septum formation protein